MINVKITVETEDQNLKVQERVKNLNKEAGRTAWIVYLDSGNGYYNYQDYDHYRAVCSRIKNYRFLVINKNLDLIICTTEDIWKKRKEKEVSFEDFMENRMKKELEELKASCFICGQKHMLMAGTPYITQHVNLRLENKTYLFNRYALIKCFILKHKVDVKKMILDYEKRKGKQ